MNRFSDFRWGKFFYVLMVAIFFKSVESFIFSSTILFTQNYSFFWSNQWLYSFVYYANCNDIQKGLKFNIFKFQISNRYQFKQKTPPLLRNGVKNSHIRFPFVKELKRPNCQSVKASQNLTKIRIKAIKISEKRTRLKVQDNWLITGTFPTIIFHSFANMSRKLQKMAHCSRLKTYHINLLWL